MAYLCSVCETPTNYFCGKCQIVCYCSTLCQKIHWRQHNPKCLPILTNEYIITQDIFEPPKNMYPDEIEIYDPLTLLDLDITNLRLLKKVIAGIHTCIIQKKNNLALALLNKCHSVDFYIPRKILSSICIVNSAVLVLINDNIGGLEELRKAIRLDPRNSTSYYNLSLFYINMNDENVILMLHETVLQLENKPTTPVPLCICGKSSIQTCATCELVCYCSDECQHTDLKNHDKICVKKLTISEINTEKKVQLGDCSNEKISHKKNNASSIYNRIMSDIEYIYKIIINSEDEFNRIYDTIYIAISKNKPIIALQLLNKCKPIYYKLSHTTISDFCLLEGTILIMLKQYIEGYNLLCKSIQFNRRNTESYCRLIIYYLAVGKTEEINILQTISLTLKKLCICKKIGTLTCGNCKTTHYCSKECQKTDWKTHKKICVKI